MIIILLGRSGSGKGEQVERLEKKLKPVLAIHTGSRFRILASQKTLGGRLARSFLKKGNLAPDWFASYLWIDALVRGLDEKKNVIFDGSPRQKHEARLLDEVLSVFGRKNLVAIYIDVSEKEVTRRLLLRGRGDDNSSAIKNRLDFFKTSVLPSIQYYKKTKRLITINGEQPMEKVFADICKALHLPPKFRDVLI